MPAAFRALPVLCFATLCVSCSSLMDNAERSLPGRPQASDALTTQKAVGMAVLRATAVATVNQPLTTARTGLAVLWNRPRAFFTENNPLPLLVLRHPNYAPGSEKFERRLDQLGCPRRSRGRVEWLVDGKEFFPEFDRALAEARSEIDVQMFIFDNDDIATRYADKLRAASATRKVRVLYDDLGTASAQGSAPKTPAPAGFSPPEDIKAYLESGSQIRVRRILNPWLVCDHTKLIVTDRNRCALLGGMNIGREYYSEWHDLMVRVGGPVVADLSREFTRAWRRAGPWGDLALIRRPVLIGKTKTPSTGGVPVRILRTDPAVGIHHIHEAAVLAIRSAKRRVWLETPYFAHAGIARELAAAAARGVDVRVIIPAGGDSAIMKDANLASAAFLIRSGVKVFRYPGMTHMKVMLCDEWAQAGSANMDTLSLRINRELNIAVSDETSIRSLENKVFLLDFRRSKRLSEKEAGKPSALLARFLAQQL